MSWRLQGASSSRGSSLQGSLCFPTRSRSNHKLGCEDGVLSVSPEACNKFIPHGHGCQKTHGRRTLKLLGHRKLPILLQAFEVKSGFHYFSNCGQPKDVAAFMKPWPPPPVQLDPMPARTVTYKPMALISAMFLLLPVCTDQEGPFGFCRSVPLPHPFSPFETCLHSLCLWDSMGVGGSLP
jgi:hypothetical protein